MDGDKSFSSADLDELGNADDVSTSHRERSYQLEKCTMWGNDGRCWVIR